MLLAMQFSHTIIMSSDLHRTINRLDLRVNVVCEHEGMRSEPGEEDSNYVEYNIHLIHIFLK